MKNILIFLFLNFGGLYLGAILMGNPQENVWYNNMNQAPWTPPGWVFGAAWTLIMICYSIYLGLLLPKIEPVKKSNFWVSFAFTWILNVSWNPLFFRLHFILIGLMILIALIGSLAIIARFGLKRSPKLILLLLPYFIWGIIATSLNAYIYLYN